MFDYSTSPVDSDFHTASFVTLIVQIVASFPILLVYSFHFPLTLSLFFLFLSNSSCLFCSIILFSSSSLCFLYVLLFLVLLLLLRVFIFLSQPFIALLLLILFFQQFLFAIFPSLPLIIFRHIVYVCSLLEFSSFSHPPFIDQL